MTKIVLICTDRGKHRPVRIGEADDGQGELVITARRRASETGRSSGDVARRTRYGRAVVHPTAETKRPYELRERRLQPAGPTTYELCCPKCSRNVQMRFDTWRDAWTRLVDAGITYLDVSRLPF